MLESCGSKEIMIEITTEALDIWYLPYFRHSSYGRCDPISVCHPQTRRPDKINPAPHGLRRLLEMVITVLIRPTLRPM